MNYVCVPNFGNIGNIMMQYMFAEKICLHVPNCKITNLNLPEWNKEFIGIPEKFEYQINIHEHSEIDFDLLAENYSDYDELRIDLTGFFQRLELFPELDQSRALFNAIIRPSESFSENDLVINIRAGEITSGEVSWYPILPISFYEFLIKITGLTPVFVGQLEENTYTEQIKAAFPDARLYPSRGPIYDFQLLRSAKNICIAVSTFSWLAAWLSEAKQVFFPMAGFLNPAFKRCYGPYFAPTNLAPVDDSRYRFFAMPFFYNEPLPELMKHHQTLKNSYLELQPSAVRHLRDHSPLNPVKLTKPVYIDHKWYVKNYPQAAIEIAEGLYESPGHHFAAIGAARGYKAFPPIGYQPIYRNLAIDKSTSQSSISEWSFEKSIEADSQRVINGNLIQVFGCHTDEENFPWWEIDLGGVHEIEAIKIYNRDDDPVTAARLFPFSVRFVDENDKSEIAFDYLNPIEEICTQVENVIDVRFKLPRKAKSVRITVEAENRILNIKQVQIFGLAVN